MKFTVIQSPPLKTTKPTTAGTHGWTPSPPPHQTSRGSRPATDTLLESGRHAAPPGSSTISGIIELRSATPPAKTPGGLVLLFDGIARRLRADTGRDGEGAAKTNVPAEWQP